MMLVEPSVAAVGQNRDVGMNMKSTFFEEANVMPYAAASFPNKNDVGDCSDA